LFTESVADLAWVDLHAVPESIAQAVGLDFDSVGRCCGLEIRDTPRVIGTAVQTEPCQISPAADAFLVSTDDEVLKGWGRAIICYGGAGDPDLSLHWYSRRAYDYTAELEELRHEVDWLFVGVSPGGLFRGLRFLAPSEHVRGLSAEVSRAPVGRRRFGVGELRAWFSRRGPMKRVP
jgi:hypothetical protein